MWVFFATASYPFLHHAQHTSEDKFVQINLLCLCTAHMLRHPLITIVGVQHHRKMGQSISLEQDQKQRPVFLDITQKPIHMHFGRIRALEQRLNGLISLMLHIFKQIIDILIMRINVERFTSAVSHNS